MMDGRQHIYYALGILAFAMAKADGKVQEEERKKLFEIIKKETDHNIDFQYAEIIFQLLERDRFGLDRIYDWAIEELKKSRHYLSNEAKAKMIEVIRQIAESFEGVSDAELSILERFTKDVNDIGVDHVIK